MKSGRSANTAKCTSPLIFVYLLLFVITTACSLSADAAVATIKQHMDSLRAMIGSKEQAMVGRVRQESKAKLKALDLHRANVEMMQQCAAAMVASCKELAEQSKQVRG